MVSSRMRMSAKSTFFSKPSLRNTLVRTCSCSSMADVPSNHDTVRMPRSTIPAGPVEDKPFE